MKKKTTPVQDTLFPGEETAPDTGINKLKLVDLKQPAKPGRKMQGWVQSDTVAHEQIWRLNMKNHVAVSVLYYMVARMGREATGFVASGPTLAAALGVSVRTIQTAVQLLKQFKFVQILKSGNTNVYVINSKVAWRGERDQRVAIFNPMMVLNQKEQEGRTEEELNQEADELLPVPDMSFFAPLMKVIDMPEGEEPRFVEGNEDGDAKE